MKMFGLTRDEEWTGKSFEDFVAPESRRGLPDVRAERAAGNPLPERHEVVALRADGSRFDMEISPAAMTFQGKPATQAILGRLLENSPACRLHHSR